MIRTNLFRIIKGLFAIAIPFNASAQTSNTQFVVPINAEEAAELRSAVAEFAARHKQPGIELKSFSEFLRTSKGFDDAAINRILADKVNLQSLKDYAKSVQSEPFKS